MHISEGILNTPIVVISSIITIIIVSYFVKILEVSSVGKTGSLSALFFVASFIHIPLGFTSIHLVLSGLIGALLGFEAILAIFIALLFQGLFFGYGGISTLGINTLIIAIPALLGYFIYNTDWRFKLFLVGSVPIVVSSLLLFIVLIINGDEFITSAKLIFLANIPLCVIEGIISYFTLKFLQRMDF